MKNPLEFLPVDAANPGFSSRFGRLRLLKIGLSTLVAAMTLLSGTAKAQWLGDYEYRKSLAINAGVNAGTNYQVQVKVGESSGATGFDLHVEGKAVSFPDDIRFTDDDGTTSLGHWLESISGTTPNRTATFWVKVNDSLDSSQSIYTYYRKSGDTSGSAGTATFAFFDDFSGGSIDGAKWIIDNATGWSVSGGELNGTNTSGRIRSQSTFSVGTILETKHRSVTRPGNGNMALGFFTSASENFGWLNHPGGDYMRINSVWTGIGNEYKDNIPVIARITAKTTTQVDLYVYRIDNGTVWHNRTNNNSNISNERITLGNRYDNGFTNQTYNAYWDWVRVRKYASSVPNLGVVGAEEANSPSITLTAPTEGLQVVTGASATATATVSSGTPPYTVEFFKTFNGGGAVSAGVDNTDPYSIDLGVLADGNYTIYATVTDSTSPTPVSATSSTRNFTVAPDASPPSPDPMTFAVSPLAASETSIRMVATTATDLASPSVEYYFENTTNSTNSGWVSSPTWVDTGLTLGVTYNYRVRARDSATPANLTAFSSVFSATTGEPPPRPITLVNPGFELPVLGYNQSSGNVPGWTPLGNVTVAAAWYPSAEFYASGAPEGRNIGDIYLSPAYSGFSQILQGAEGQLQEHANYELKVKVGRNNLDAYEGYIIQLLVNGIVIAQDDNSNTPGAGAFINTSLKYTYNAGLHSGLVGYPIEIRLLSKGLAGGFGDVNFDDVQISCSTFNLLAHHGGPYRLSQGTPLTLNGSASLPSPGATITSYEWDLDSRNDHLGFIADRTGATPAAISFSALTNTYGMAPGVNTIRLRISDNSGQSVTTPTTVSIFTLYTYQGPDNPRGNDENWNKTANWNTGAVPSGLVDVLIPASKFIPCISSTTPKYTGNLSIGANSQISLGWTTSGTAVANSLGTPGTSVVTMNSGSSINIRIGGTPSIPGISLLGNASVTLGSSTQGGAQASFNHPITGAYRLSFYGNSTQSCVANMNAPNTFNEIYTAGGPYVDGGVTIVGNASGSLGTGNLTLTALGGGGNSGLVVINAENSMADTATLSMSGNSATKITMNANDTIAGLIINGVQMPAGTYGSSSSAATFKQTWMAGTGILTVAQGQGTIWDINGATAGAGGASPSGTWDSGTANWTTSTTGEAAAASWVGGRTAVFAAGSDAIDPYTVNVGGPNSISVTNSFTNKASTGTSSFSTTQAGWALSGGNCVAVMVSSINATGFTASYGGLPMTVQGVNQTPVNAYVGIAYIIAGINGAPDPLPSTGDVVINVPRVLGVGNGGGYANMGTVYSIQSLSNVASAGTADSYAHPPGSNPPASKGMTYSTSVNNSYVLGAVCDSNWQTSPKSVVGLCNQIISNSNTAKPGYYNPMLCSGPVVAAGSYTDVYSSSLTALITLPFNAKSTPNPLLAAEGQKIAGLTFEEGAVTINGSALALQINSPFTSNSGITATIASKITGLSGLGPIKKGQGTVIFSNSTNDYTGSTTISNGVLRLGASNALPNTAVSIAGDAPGVTATLDLNGYSNTVAGLTLGGSSATSGSSIITGAGTLTLGGNVVFNSLNSPLGATVAGNLSLGSSTRTFDIKDSGSAANDLAVSAAIGGTGGLTKSGFGTLLLSGNNTYTGATTVSTGLLVLSGADNSAAAGNVTVNGNAAIRFDSLGAINGTGKNVTIAAGGLAYFGPSFDPNDISDALSRINLASEGVIAVNNFASTDFDFSVDGLNVYLGAVSDVTYNGDIIPYGGVYRIGGGTGSIILSGANALTGGNSLVVGGKVVIANANNMTGATTINAGGRLQIGSGGTLGSLASSSSVTNNGILAFNRSNTLTQGTDFWSSISGSGVVEKSGAGNLIFNAENTYTGGTNLLAGTLVLSHAAAIGTGPLSIYSGSLDASSPLTLSSNNPITIGGGFGFGGTANLNMGTGAVGINGNHTITLNGTNKSLTLGGVVSNNSGGNQILTVNGTGNTLVLGGYNMSSNVYATLMGITIGGTGNVSITGPVNDWTGGHTLPYDPFDVRLGTLTKTGAGTLTLSGNNNYTGNTVVAGGVLHLAGGTQISPILVNNGGILAFTLGTTITSSKRLTLNDGHRIRIMGTPTLNSYTLMIADSIVGGAPTLEEDFALLYPLYFLEIAGNELRLTKSDITPPGLVDIVNDKGTGATVGPIPPNTLVNYTVSFNEDIQDGVVTAADFSNAGTSAITFGTIMEISPGVFTVEVTPTTAGTLLLRIPGTALIEDIAGNDLVVPLDDDTTINVAVPDNNWLVGADIVDDKLGAPISPGTLVTYTVYFSRDIDHLTVTSDDFDNAGIAPITIGAIAEIEPGTFTVEVTPTGFGTLQLRVPTSAIIEDPSDNVLDCNPAIEDDTSIDVADPYTVWTGGGPTFSDDANGDGIANGLAWLLGAGNPTEDARDLLPTVAAVSGELRLSFITLDDASRGAASIKVQYSKDMGVADLWTSHEAEVPDTSSTVNGIDFVIAPISDGYIDVEARIPASAALPGKKLFSRVSVNE